MVVSLHTESVGEFERGPFYWRLWQTDERGLCKRSFSPCGSSGNENWRKGFCSRKTASCVRHVKVGFGNGAFLSIQRIREGNLDGQLLY